ncbi:hypothetical protein J3458_009282 [Metarhizium acridum]|uniref:uncharacterized protein n=1 Tax=Metarhizium acridum TaxID=92637 RepID=UPI001C6CB07B|nr:hypothetical protein J3458_009282 [Metarhizium acridum]
MQTDYGKSSSEDMTTFENSTNLGSYWSLILSPSSVPDSRANRSKTWADHENLSASHEPIECASNFTSLPGRRTPFVFRWEGQHNDKQSNHTYNHTKWDALLDITKQISGDQTSAYEGIFHAGGRHIVRRIKPAERDELWVARIPIISDVSVLGFDSGWWTSEKQFTMESEIATVKFISSPPISPYQESGVCIQHGPRKKPSNAPLDKLGSLVLKSNGDIDIGPLPSQFGFKGPFDFMTDYFSAWAAHNAEFKNICRLKDMQLIRATESFPQRLKLMSNARMIAKTSRNYPIIHPDFQMHNLLLDDSYDIVGVIDWEFAHTAPVEIFAARMNMYASLDSQGETINLVDEGKQYIADIADTEMNLNPSCRLSGTFGSILGELGLCMHFYEEGIALSFNRVLDRAEKLYLTQL